jgi:hypothetical protein
LISFGEWLETKIIKQTQTRKKPVSSWIKYKDFLNEILIKWGKTDKEKKEAVT